MGDSVIKIIHDDLINKLFAQIDGLPDALEWNLKVIDGRAQLKIGALRRENIALNFSLLKAFKRGKISAIDSGPVVSPKVFILIWHLLQVAHEQNLLVRFSGRGTLAKIVASFETQKNITNPQHFDYLSAEDKIAFVAALEGLGVDQACQKDLIHCGCREFIFISGYSPDLRWQKCEGEP